MSSPDRRAILAVALVAAATLGLSGCQVRPLYAEGGAAAASGPVVDELRSIAVEVQKDRVAQELMNQLIFALRGGAALTNPRYTLDLIVTSRSDELAIQERVEVPTANLITITATYTLLENATRRVVTSGTVYQSASYDFSSQRFANLRAQRDAEDRAARTVAQDIRTRLAAVLATR